MYNPYASIVIGILATLGMTAFSHLVSYLSGNKCKQPQLLNTLIRNSPKTRLPLENEHVIGWAIPIHIGIMFVNIFDPGHQFLDSTIATNIYLT